MRNERPERSQEIRYLAIVNHINENTFVYPVEEELMVRAEQY